MDLLLDSNIKDPKKDDDAIPNKDENDSSNPNKMISLRIRTNNESTVYSLSIKQSCSVLQLKESVRTKLGPAARGRYLRLVCQGRLLAPDCSKLDNFQLKQNSVVHAVLAAPGIRGGQQAALSQESTSSSSRRRFRGIGIGADGLVITRNINSSNNNDSSDADSDDSDVEEGRTGFDRLRDNGMSRSDVEVIRAYFSRQVERFREQHQPPQQPQSRSNNNESENIVTSEMNNDNSINSTTPSDDENTNRGRINSASSTSADIRREHLRWEDQWMEAQGPSSEFRLNLNTNNPLLATRAFGNAFDFAASRSSLGTDRDFGWGFFLGFFMGFVMMFWVWIPTVPHKQKLGILTGICFQMTLNMLRNRSIDDVEE